MQKSYIKQNLDTVPLNENTTVGVFTRHGLLQDVRSKAGSGSAELSDQIDVWVFQLWHQRCHTVRGHSATISISLLYNDTTRTHFSGLWNMTIQHHSKL